MTPRGLSHPVGIIVVMITPCPCGCGRRLSLSPTQIRDIVTVRRTRWEVHIADAYGCSLSTVRHLREAIRSDGTVIRSA